MRLALLTPTQRRLVLSAYLGHMGPQLDPAQNAEALRLLLDRRWAPTPEATPIPFATLETWYQAVCEPRRTA
jgi:hypothetical protein